MCWSAAAQHPDRLRAIVPIALPNPNHLPRNLRLLIGARHFVAHKMPGAEWRARRNDFAYLEKLYERWAPGWRGPERDACIERAKEAFADPRSLQAAMDHYRALTPRPYRELDAKADVRVLAVADAGIPPAVFERSVANLGDGEVAAFPTGHWPHREREDEFIARLLDFLQTVN